MTQNEEWKAMKPTATNNEKKDRNGNNKAYNETRHETLPMYNHHKQHSDIHISYVLTATPAALPLLNIFLNKPFFFVTFSSDAATTGCGFNAASALSRSASS